MIDVEQIRTKDGDIALVFSSFRNTVADEKGVTTIDQRREIKSVDFTTVYVRKHDIYNWMECDPSDGEREPDLINQIRRPVKKQTAVINTKKGRYEPVRLNKYRVMEIIHRLEKSEPEKYKKIFTIQEPIKYFCDIETEVIKGFPDITVGREKVLCITICDQYGNATVLSTYNMATTDRSRLSESVNRHFAEKLPHKKFNITYEYHTSEDNMLKSFFYVWMKKISFIAGWNFLKFDWAYLVKRAQVCGLSPEKCGYPNEKFQTLSLRDKWNKKKKTLVPVPLHKAIIDYLMIYEKWDQSIKLKTNNSLEWVAMELFGVGKEKYPGTLQDFYERDPYNFIIYNIIDTILVALIDEKLGTFKTMLSLTNEGMVSLNDSMFASSVVEMLSYGEYISKNMVYTKPSAAAATDENEKDETDDGKSYSGGWVMEVTPGIFKDVITVDFESLFPSIMSAFNTGLDTFIGKCIYYDSNKNNYIVSTVEKPTVVKAEGINYTLDKRHTTKIKYDKGGEAEVTATNMYLSNYDGKVYPLTKDHIMTSYGAIFSKLEDSVMRLVVNKLLNKRVYNKIESGVVAVEIKELEQRLKLMKK